MSHEVQGVSSVARRTDSHAFGLLDRRISGDSVRLATLDTICALALSFSLKSPCRAAMLGVLGDSVVKKDTPDRDPRAAAMSAERIEFSLVPFPIVQALAGSIPRPYPAVKEVPGWFRAIPSETDSPAGHAASTRTLKNCPPFLEAMTCGYILPAAADLSLSLDPAGRFHGESRDLDIVQIHSVDQVKGSPFAKLPVLKILNPWLVRTPPGYSTLFLPLLNRFEMPLVPLAGLVETDVFYREVNFPAVLSIPLGTTLNIPRGTPLVQMIPVKREEFQADFEPADAEKYGAMDLQTRDSPENYNFYKNHYWQKKAYR
jgi:hypothetical protein